MLPVKKLKNDFEGCGFESLPKIFKEMSLVKQAGCDPLSNYNKEINHALLIAKYYVNDITSI